MLITAPDELTPECYFLAEQFWCWCTQPTRRQTIGNHHTNLAMTTVLQECLLNMHITTQPLLTHKHYNDVMMSAMASQITSLTIVYSTVYSSADQRNHQSSASLAFVWGIHRWPVNSPHKGPATRKMFPFNDVIMKADRRIYASLNYTIIG